MTNNNKIRADRNRTLIVSKEEIPVLKKAITLFDTISEKTSFIDALINADALTVLDKIPNECADLIIIDPPYNLNKTFNSSKFSAMSDNMYEEYLRTWFKKVCDKLKPNGSLYMCGDWKCSSSQQKVISEELTIINRITWQREKGRGAKKNWNNAM